MANHPLNLGLRFILELAAWASMGTWGWQTQDGIMRWLWALGLPLAAMFVWGGFRDPRDHGKGLVATPGPLRLLIEIIEWGGAVWLLALAGQPAWAAGLGLLMLIHTALSYDRLLWLIRGN